MSKLATCSCPVCSEEMRIDTLVRHCKTRHREELYNSMPTTTRKTICKLQIPILFGYHNNEKVLYVCLSCGKGNNCRSRKNGSIGGRISDVCASHKDCSADWKEYANIYTDLESAPVSLPYPIKRNDNSKKAAVKREVVAEGTPVVAGMTDEQKALLKQLMDILDPQVEGWEDDEEEEEKSIDDQLSNLIRIAKKNQTSEDKYKASIAKQQKRVAALEEEIEMLKEAAPTSVPANVADLRELLRESNECKEELKEQVDSLRSQLSAANMNALPSIEITDNTEELRAENEGLKEEIEGLVSRGCVEPSLISPLMKVYHDNISEPVEDPTINDMVRLIIQKLS